MKEAGTVIELSDKAPEKEEVRREIAQRCAHLKEITINNNKLWQNWIIGVQVHIMYTDTYMAAVVVFLYYYYKIIHNTFSPLASSLPD